MADIDALGALVSRILDHLSTGAPAPMFREPLRRGSASGSVAIVDAGDDSGELVLRVELTIMRVPAEGSLPFFRRLLELNRSLQGRGAFSVDGDDIVWLESGRPVDALDPDEIIELLLWTSEQADHFDDVLLTEFGYENRL